MTSYEACQHIKRAGWKENVIIRTVKEFSPDGDLIAQTTITSTEWTFTQPTTELACVHALGWIKARVKPVIDMSSERPPMLDQWRFADREVREQREREVMAMRLNDQSCSSILSRESNVHPIFAGICKHLRVPQP